MSKMRPNLTQQGARYHATVGGLDISLISTLVNFLLSQAALTIICFPQNEHLIMFFIANNFMSPSTVA